MRVSNKENKYLWSLYLRILLLFKGIVKEEKTKILSMLKGVFQVIKSLKDWILLNLS